MRPKALDLSGAWAQNSSTGTAGRVQGYAPKLKKTEIRVKMLATQPKRSPTHGIEKGRFAVHATTCPSRGFRVGWLAAIALLLFQGGEEAIRAATLPGGIEQQLAGVGIPFIANAGQTDPAVAYYAPTFAGTVFITRDGQIVYSLPTAKTPGSGTLASQNNSGWSLTETLVGGRPSPNGSERAMTHVSYFLENDASRWKSDLPTFDAVTMGEVWPRIRLALRAQGKNVEKLFTVEPGGDPSMIRVRVAGARSLRVNPAGALVVKTDPGEVTFTPPLAFQESAGVRRPVRVAYRVSGKEYGFRLGEYDPELPVEIDPLLQATYLGGSSGDDLSKGVVVHPITGDVYVAGSTFSTNFPGTAGGVQTAYAGNGDAFIARLNSSLTSLIQATYLGGNGGGDSAGGLAIHPTSGDVYVIGVTGSSNFPGTAGGAQAASGGDADAFVARLNSSLTTLIQATYLGGNNTDVAEALVIHPASGDVYVAGNTGSSNFPGTAGGAQSALLGLSDAFLARLNSSLTTLTQATYLGGNGSDSGKALGIHPTSGDVYVAGVTGSSNFPGTAGGAQTASGGLEDAFVARLNSSLTTLIQATYLGGSGSESGGALGIHPTSGDVYVAGYTPSADFPGTAGGAQATNGGNEDAFVARLNASLTVLAQATYLGGSSIELAGPLAIHPSSGDVYVGGVTYSSDFPGTAGGVQTAYAGNGDAFIARLNSSLTSLVQATYLGGNNGADSAGGLAIHPTSSDVYVAGVTGSSNFPGTAGGAQPASGGLADVFVAHLTPNLATAAEPTITPTNTPTITPVGTPANTPTSGTGGSVPTLSPGSLFFFALALASVALFLLRKSAF